MKKIIIWGCLLLMITSACQNKKADNKINLRLKWAYQAQFAGYLIAKEKGFYKDADIDVNVQPAGPDLKPYSTVASGSDDVGVGIISQLLTARSNQVPLVAIAQVFQDSPNRFVLKQKNKINSLQDLKGKKVGLWMGGDEIEFIAMLKSAGMTLNDIEVIPQKFSIAPFLQDAYVCSQVMVYNELNQVRTAGFQGDALQVISPKDYHAAILGDMLFTNEKFLAGHQEQLQKFLIASFKGWTYAKEHPEEAVNIVLKYNPELKKQEQTEQLQAVLSIIFNDSTKQHGLGYIDACEYENAKAILLGGMETKDPAYQRLKATVVKSAYNSELLAK
jgi:NitT/TauT family transport system substrate-binding protein